jgi:HPt (histidine-containing phosphotransfer) domain-containing protein
MINVSPVAVEDGSKPTPASVERSIDLVHLARMTLGDRGLEREVLQLFDRQSTMLLARLRQGPPATAAALAHTIKGSARGIGAGRVACAAEAVEAATATGSEAALGAAVDRLGAATDEARAMIAELLRAN